MKKFINILDINGIELFVGDKVLFNDSISKWVATIKEYDNDYILVDDKGDYDLEPEWEFVQKID